MTSTFTCLECGEVLRVEGNAPARVTCPKCLALVLNPRARVPPQIQPREVLPVEEETKADVVDIGRLLTVMWLLLLGAGIVAAGVGEWSMSLLFIVPGVLIAIFTGLVFARAPRKYIPELHVPPRTSPDGSTVLDYAHRRARRESVDNSFRIGPFISGFFTTIAVAAAGAAFLIRSKSLQELLFILFVTALAEYAVAHTAFVLGQEPRFNGIGRGVAVGLILVMIAVLPLGACFFLAAYATGGGHA